MPNNQEIRGNTLKAYLHLLKHGPSELREVQRGLELSSASLASYHLGKLVEANYVKQDEQGKYFAIKDASAKVLEGYSKVGPAVVPQLFFFSLLFTIVVAFFSLEALYGSDFTFWLIVVCVAMVAVFWYETLILWRKLTAWQSGFWIILIEFKTSEGPLKAF
ncbi:MAG: winged helix-turn-helix domain-containing protein [Candidatus Bathyarchaeia archaeon]|jgi:hypothetical protein